MFGPVYGHLITTYCYNCGTDSHSMHTWYIRQACLFSITSNLAIPLFPNGMPLFYIHLQMSLFPPMTHLYSDIYDAFIISTYDLSLSTNTSSLHSPPCPSGIQVASEDSESNLSPIQGKVGGTQNLIRIQVDSDLGLSWREIRALLRVYLECTQTPSGIWAESSCIQKVISI